MISNIATSDSRSKVLLEGDASNVVVGAISVTMDSAGESTTKSLSTLGLDFNDDDIHYVLKILTPSNVAGALIGKGGIVINSMMEASGAKIRCSQSTDFFPGTVDRVVLLSGTSGEVSNAIDNTITKLCQTLEHEHNLANKPQAIPHLDHFGNVIYATPPSLRLQYQPSVRILIPLAASGAIIGRSGATIKNLSEFCGCRIQLAENTPSGIATSERIVTISGPSISHVVVGVQLVTKTFHKDAQARTYNNVTTSYSKVLGGRGQAAVAGHLAAFSQPQKTGGRLPTSISPTEVASAVAVAMSEGVSVGTPQSTGGSTVSVVIGVPDNMLGSVLGKGGSVVKEIIAHTGANIQISQKGEFLPDTNNRSITVSGSESQVQGAQAYILYQLGRTAGSSAAQAASSSSR